MKSSIDSDASASSTFAPTEVPDRRSGRPTSRPATSPGNSRTSLITRTPNLKVRSHRSGPLLDRIRLIVSSHGFSGVALSCIRHSSSASPQISDSSSSLALLTRFGSLAILARFGFLAILARFVSLALLVPYPLIASSIISIMSLTTNLPEFPVAFTASSKRETSNGQQTASTSAPVSTASITRRSLRRILV